MSGWSYDQHGLAGGSVAVRVIRTADPLAAVKGPRMPPMRSLQVVHRYRDFIADQEARGVDPWSEEGWAERARSKGYKLLKGLRVVRERTAKVVPIRPLTAKHALTFAAQAVTDGERALVAAVVQARTTMTLREIGKVLGVSHVSVLRMIGKEE